MAVSGSEALRNLLKRSGWDYAVVWKLDESYRPIYHSGLYWAAPHAFEDQCRTTFAFAGFTFVDTAGVAMKTMQAQPILYPQAQPIPNAAHDRFHWAARTQTILYIPGFLLQGKALVEMGTAQTVADYDRIHHIVEHLGRQFYAEEESWQKQQQMFDTSLFIANSPLLDLGSPASCSTDCSEFFNFQPELEDVPRVLQARQETVFPELVNQLQQVLITSSRTAPNATMNEILGSLPADRQLQIGDKQKAQVHARNEKARRENQKAATDELKRMLGCKKKDKVSILRHTVARIRELEGHNERLREIIKRKDEEIEKLRRSPNN